MRLLKKVLRTALPLAILLAPVVFWINHQAIYDWYQLRNYTPPTSISNLAASDGMNPSSRNIFFVNHPQLLEDIKQFRASCVSSEQTIILGCYHSDQAGIYIYNVKDARLAGIQEVTAAHEMLHAVYDRLSAKEKNTVNNLLLDFYQHDLTDQRIKDTINDYKKSEPKDVVNEMHSIFGTEVATLPLALENYYKQYFSKRSLVVEFSQKYEAEFSSRSAKAHVYETQLAAMKQKIETEENNLKNSAAQIESQRSSLENLRSSNRVDEYNAQVSVFNTAVDSYNVGVNAYKKDVNAYNSLLGEYNKVAGELSTLFDAIDTRLGVQPAKASN